MQKVISSVIINEDKELLIARKKNIWILPGGKPEPGESSFDCIFRELREEINVGVRSLSFFTKVRGISPHKGKEIEVFVYNTEIYGEPKEGSEILEVRWVGFPLVYNLSNVTRKIVDMLFEEGRL